MSYYSVESFVLAFLATNVIEFIPLHFLIRQPLAEKAKKLVMINALTLPLVWLVFPYLPADFAVAFIVIEVLVILAEGVMVKQLFAQTWTRALKIAAIMNALSALAGLFLF